MRHTEQAGKHLSSHPHVSERLNHNQTQEAAELAGTSARMQNITLGMSFRSEGTSIRKSPWFMMLVYSRRGRRKVLRSTGSSPICTCMTTLTAKGFLR